MRYISVPLVYSTYYTPYILYFVHTVSRAYYIPVYTSAIKCSVCILYEVSISATGNAVYTDGVYQCHWYTQYKLMALVYTVYMYYILIYMQHGAGIYYMYVLYTDTYVRLIYMKYITRLVYTSAICFIYSIHISEPSVYSIYHCHQMLCTTHIRCGKYRRSSYTPCI